MDEFFAIYDIAKRDYGVERRVKINSNEIQIYLYLDGKIIVRAEGEPAEREKIYLDAAKKLINWMQQGRS